MKTWGETEEKDKKVGAWADEPVAAGAEGKDKKEGAGACELVAAGAEEKDEQVGAWADEPVAAGAEGKDEKVEAWAAAEGEEKDEKEGAGACELVAAGAEEKDEQVGAWVCAPAAAQAEEKDEQVGAGACITAKAEAEEKDEKVGAGVCVTAAAKAEEKEEQVGAGACVPAVAEAERKDKKAGARPCVLKAEKQVQGSMRAEQHVRKLEEECPELVGKKMVKEAARGADTGEQEEVARESKEVGAWECLPVGGEREHTMENATSQEAEEAVKTVRWIKGGTWADELMRLAFQVLSESRGMEEAEKWAAWEGGKAVGHLKEVILASVEDLHVVQMGDACSYEQRQQLGGRGTEEAGNLRGARRVHSAAWSMGDVSPGAPERSASSAQRGMVNGRLHGAAWSMGDVRPGAPERSTDESTVANVALPAAPAAALTSSHTASPLPLPQPRCDIDAPAHARAHERVVGGCAGLGGGVGNDESGGKKE
ncbi:unnamed protein product [Closterium sp. NIES-64]|nr:unnamed protein product [Closterium sp. NIES-64]